LFGVIVIAISPAARWTRRWPARTDSSPGCSSVSASHWCDAREACNASRLLAGRARRIAASVPCRGGVVELALPPLMVIAGDRVTESANVW